MATPQHPCATCGSAHIHRNGHRSGPARCRGNGCGHQARFVRRAAAERAARCGPVEKRLAGRHSPRSIGRVTGATRVRVANLAKKSAEKCWEVLELGEMGPFVGRRRHNAWRWLAVERARRRAVARGLGRRDAATARRP